VRLEVVYKSGMVVVSLAESGAGVVQDSDLVEHICSHHRMLLLHSTAVVAVAIVLDAVVGLDKIFHLVVHFLLDPYASGWVEASRYPPCLILTLASLLSSGESHLFVY